MSLPSHGVPGRGENAGGEGRAAAPGIFAEIGRIFGQSRIFPMLEIHCFLKQKQKSLHR